MLAQLGNVAEMWILEYCSYSRGLRGSTLTHGLVLCVTGMGVTFSALTLLVVSKQSGDTCTWLASH